ncbi:hypothetical protein PISL3812_09751 [Talaromyces islandicus]|uniref:Uncharacterized protein n=1 Tax=Talaromyces islandicus TaxID=28573 RepID=A0A0U1MCL1_TALIS|nr:hypothetical protein PISL3812_09751 [Talaromyces islandicus]
MGLNVVYDGIGKDQTENDMYVVAKHETIVTYGAVSGFPAPISPAKLAAKNVKFVGPAESALMRNIAFLEGETDLDILAKDALHATGGASILSVSAKSLKSVLKYLLSDANKIDVALYAKSVIRATSVAVSIFDNVNGDGTFGDSARISLAGTVNATAAGTFNGTLEASLNVVISGLPAIHLGAEQVRNA